jgi:putative membrane protein
MKAFVPVLAALFIAAPAFAQGKKMDAKDSRTLTHLIQANLAEVQTGKLAERKAQDQQVKDFGKRMADDHGKLLSQLQDLAQQKGVKAPDSPSAKDQATMKKLESSKDFDQAYMQDMVKDHRKDVKEIKKVAQEAKDPDLKAAAQKAAPILEAHLKMAQGMEGKSSDAARGR